MKTNMDVETIIRQLGIAPERFNEWKTLHLVAKDTNEEPKPKPHQLQVQKNDYT